MKKITILLVSILVCFVFIFTSVSVMPAEAYESYDTKVLVVDDYATERRIVKNLLTEIGITSIDQAGDGITALQKLRERKYDLVISDWTMEPMTGLQLLKKVRADSSLNSTRFIMISTESKTENVIAAKEAGVNNYIVKPFNANTLEQKIQTVL
jgi:two-component system chemotaxis response regulator CheY